MSEQRLVREIQVAVSEVGARLLRNNCGSFMDATGSWVQFGVANPGGSDLIGWTEIVITPKMVGQIVAVFTAVEAKSIKGKTTKDQDRFIKAVRDAGGIAVVARSVDDVMGEMRGFREKGF